MAENKIVEETVESDKSAELVEVSFVSKGVVITREVYPEVAKFINSRKQAEADYYAALRQSARTRQAYIWEKEDEFFADPANVGRSFDEYSVGRQWDRINRASTRQETERKYFDFVNASHREPSYLNRAENPNSWAILRDEAHAAGHKMVTWLVDNTLENESEATILVKYLPATVEELWQIAKDDHEMCGVFDRYMERAERAGLFKDIDIPASLREQRALRSYLTRNYGSSYARDTMTHLAPVLTAEREAAVTKARAEWDKELLEKFSASGDMNELLRSLADGHPLVQQHLNRSDAAKAAWERRRAQQDQSGQGSASEEAVAVDGVDQVAGVTSE